VGSLSVGTAAAVTGDLSVDGTASVESVSVTADATVTGALSVGTSAIVGGALAVGTDQTVGGWQTVGGGQDVAESVTVGGQVAVGSWLNVAGSAQVDGGTTVGSWLQVGGVNSADGALYLRDAQGSVGLLAQSTGAAGRVWARNAAGQDAVMVDGSTALVWSGGPGNWRVLGGSPARYSSYVWLYGSNTSTQIAPIDLGFAREVFAYVAVTGCDPLDPVDRWDAFALDVFAIDGTMTAPWWWGGDHWGGQGDVENVRAQSYRGTARTVTFRARSKALAPVIGIGVVFYD
jgi:hypothetical protein